MKKKYFYIQSANFMRNLKAVNLNRKRFFIFNVRGLDKRKLTVTGINFSRRSYNDCGFRVIFINFREASLDVPWQIQ